jgi:hypothetical protein
MSRHKPLAALAAVTAAVAVAVPAATATAATTAPAVRTALIGFPHIGFPAFGPTSLTCQTMYALFRHAGMTGNTALINAVFNQILLLGCDYGAPAI